MATIGLSPKFFKNERDNAYSDWEEALFRELVQNGRDAKSTALDFYLEDTPHEGVMIGYEDNGHGMPRRILKEIYFSLGESYKAENSTGGFGRARILVPLAMDRYVLRSDDYEVSGVGSQHSDEETWDREKLTHGFLLTCWTKDSDSDKLENKLRRYVYENDLQGLKIRLNGEDLEGHPGKGKKIRDLFARDRKFAEVYYNETLPGHKMVVRVNGFSMFSNYSPQPKGQVTIELLPELSREVLTSSRDSLHYYEDSAVTRFVSELASETDTALKEKRPPSRRTFKGKGPLVAKAKPKEIVGERILRPEQKPVEQPLRAQEILRSYVVHSVREREAEIAASPPVSEPAGRSSVPGRPALRTSVPDKSAKKVYTAAEFIPDVSIYVDHQNPEVLKQIDKYDPSQWKFILNGDKPVWQNSHYEIHLLLAWMEAVRCAHECLMDSERYAPKYNVGYILGWSFSDKHEAAMERIGDHPCFYLNPLLDNGKRRFDLRKRTHVQRICADALHEVAHRVSSVHSETFAGCLTELMGLFPWEQTVKGILGIKF